MPEPHQPLRDHVANLLDSPHAHVTFAHAVAEFPEAQRGERPAGLPYSAWELVEHMRLAQWDILEYVRDPEHVSPDFPAGYWPTAAAPPSDATWNASIERFEADRAAMVALVTDHARDPLAPLPHAPEHTLLREALLLADHNAYHIGQLVALRRVLGNWAD